jgi:hypothetical protein
MGRYSTQPIRLFAMLLLSSCSIGRSFNLQHQHIRRQRQSIHVLSSHDSIRPPDRTIVAGARRKFVGGSLASLATVLVTTSTPETALAYTPYVKEEEFRGPLFEKGEP